jgi:hypothetical protein
VTTIAADIRENYGPVLCADEGEWSRIARLKAGLQKAPRLP